MTSRARMLSKYGISVAEYDRRIAEQGNRCAICGGSQPQRKRRSGQLGVALFCVDHDHQSGAVRGLLCSNCNLMLGNARDSADILRRALDYLHANEVAACR